MTVYVVMGSTGEYSDRREWPVKAFTREETAQEFVVLAEKEAREIAARLDEEGMHLIFSDEAHSMDPNFDLDYTGTSYFYYTVKVADREGRVSQ